MKGYKFWLMPVISAGLMSCGGTDEAKKEQGDEKQAVLELGVTVPVLMQPEYTIKLAGELVPEESVALFSKVRGFVKKLNVDVGDRVQQGQVLATIEAPEMDAQSTADKAKHNQLEANYEVSKLRYNRLNTVSNRKKGSISELELEKAYGDMKRDSAAMLEAGLTYTKSKRLEDYLLIRAPFSGIITARNFSVGALLGDGNTPVFHLVANEKLKLKVIVPELHSQTVSDSTMAYFQVLSVPDRQFTAYLKRNAKFIDPSTRALNLEFEVSNKDKSLIGGDFADVKLHLKRSYRTLFVPQSAVVNAQSGVFVVRIDAEGNSSRVPVRRGITHEGKVEVFGDLKEDDQLVVKATEELSNGKKVKVKKVDI